MATLAKHLTGLLQPTAAVDSAIGIGAELGYGLLADLKSSAASGLSRPTAIANKLVAVSALVARQPAGALAGGALAPIEGTSCIGIDRWETDAQAAVVGSVPVRFAGLLTDVAIFDAQAFGISGAEVAVTDPQQRLLMESLAEGLSMTSGRMRQVRGMPNNWHKDVVCRFERLMQPCQRATLIEYMHDSVSARYRMLRPTLLESLWAARGRIMASWRRGRRASPPTLPPVRKIVTAV